MYESYNTPQTPDYCFTLMNVGRRSRAFNYEYFSRSVELST